MPIIVPDHEKALFNRLQKSGATAISEKEASHQDISPARIGILNLMPAASMEKTETHWLRAISRTVLQIEPVFVKFDDDPRERKGASRESVLSRYVPFSEIAQNGLHGLIVTGDNLELRKSNPEKQELLPLDKIFYAKQLAEIVDWARSNVRTTIYSCLAAHFALKHLYNLDRQIAPSKIFGIYDHDLTGVDNDFTRGMDDVLTAPHSRWGDIKSKALESTDAQLLAVSESVGWLLAQDSNNNGGKDMFIQGHPEYGRRVLAREYTRDRKIGQVIPGNYYPDDDANKSPKLSWANDAATLYSNWISCIYEDFSMSNSTRNQVESLST